MGIIDLPVSSNLTIIRLCSSLEVEINENIHSFFNIYGSCVCKYLPLKTKNIKIQIMLVRKSNYFKLTNSVKKEITACNI